MHTPSDMTSMQIKMTCDTYTSSPVKILEVFHSNRAKLYLPSPDLDPTAADAMFSHISLPTLNQTQPDLFECPIVDMEVASDIKALKPHKRPGPDKFSAAYYK